MNQGSPMIAFAATALAGDMLLVVSVLRRTINGPTLEVVLTAHDILPSWARGRRSNLLIEAGQLGIGVTGLVAIPVLGPQSLLSRAVGLAGGALYAGFAIYLTVLLITMGDIACGCLGASERVGLPAIARAGLLASAGLVLGAAGRWMPATDLTTRLALVMMAAMIAGVMVFVVRLTDILSTRRR